MRSQFDCFIHQRFVGDHIADFDPAGRTENDVGRGIIDSGGELRGGKATEHDRVHRADARTREHGDRGFRHHGHIDDHPVAFADTQVLKTAGSQRNRIREFGIAEVLDSPVTGES